MRRKRKRRKMNNTAPDRINHEGQLFTVSCVNCNNHVFKFSQNILEEYGVVFLECPECAIETEITWNRLDGVTIQQATYR
jgi:transcription elongation factor Elf1